MPGPGSPRPLGAHGSQETAGPALLPVPGRSWSDLSYRCSHLSGFCILTPHSWSSCGHPRPKGHRSGKTNLTEGKRRLGSRNLRESRSGIPLGLFPCSCLSGETAAFVSLDEIRPHPQGLNLALLWPPARHQLDPCPQFQSSPGKRSLAQL